MKRRKGLTGTAVSLAFLALVLRTWLGSDADRPGPDALAEPAAAAPSRLPNPTPDAPVARPAGATSPGSAGDRVRLVSWNLEWLSDRDQHGTVKRGPDDYAALASYARLVDPDIAVLQEVANEAAVWRVFRADRYRAYVTEQSGVQHVAFVWKPHIDLTVVDEVEELGVGQLRESPDAQVRVGALRFRLLGVHLKSGCFEGPLAGSRDKDCAKFAPQLAILEAWMEARTAAGEEFVVAGDFNRRFNARDPAWLGLDDGEPAGFDAVLPTMGRVSQCRDNQYRDFIDHLVLSPGVARRLPDDGFRQWNYPRWNPPQVSDHCAIGLDLSVR